MTQPPTAAVRRAAALTLASASPRRLSAPGAFVRVTAYPDGRTVHQAPAPNPFGKIARAWGEFKTSIGRALLPGLTQFTRIAAEMEATFARIDAVLNAGVLAQVTAVNGEARVVGLESRYFLRGGLDLRYDTPEALSSLVRDLIDGDPEHDPDVSLLTRENRIRVAVAAMRGWEQRGNPRLHRVVCDRPPYPCAHQEAIGAEPWHTCSPMLLWRCEGHTYPEPPLIAHRLWAGTRVEVRCG